MKSKTKQPENNALKVKKKVVKKTGASRDNTTQEYTTPTITWV